MSETLDQIYINNPSTTILNTDLFYLVHSPYSPGTDSAITGANLKSSISSPLSLTGDSGTIIGSSLKIFANNAALNCGSTVSFVNSGSTSTLNVTDNNTALNTIIGLNSGTLALSTGGLLNTIFGASNLPVATSGDSNTIIGANSMLLANNSSQNVSIGAENLLSLTAGNNNTVIGTLAGAGLLTGSQNLYLGYNSGNNNNSSESYNIYLAHPGVASESNVLRLGGGTGSSAGQINKSYISGIANHTGIGSYIVTIDSATDQLGVMLIPPASIQTITGDIGTTNPSTNITIFANNAILNCGSSVSFVNSLTTSTLNLTDANSNTILGYSAGNASITGIDNVGIGTGVFNALANGIGNVALGINALLSTIGDSNLVAIGNSALSSSNGGVNLVAVGTDALRVSVADQDNTSIGFASLSSLNGGSSNTVLGSNAGLGLQTGSYNLILGSLSGGTYSGVETSNIVLNSTGVLSETNALHIGSGTGSGPQQLLTAYISGINGNTLSGTPLVVTIDSSTDQLGVAAFPSGGTVTVTGDSGSISGSSLTIYSHNSTRNCGSTVSFVNSGTVSTLNVTDANSNTFVGKGSGNLTLTGQFNSGIGQNIFPLLTTGQGNFAGGYNCLLSLVNGSNNIAVGSLTLDALTSGSNCIGIGLSAGSALINGNSCIAIGSQSLQQSTADSFNTVMGGGSFSLLNGGGSNVGLGFHSGQNLATGSFNLFLGTTAGVTYANTESSNILLNHNGIFADNNTLRIGFGTGTGAQQLSSAYISGINGNTLSGTPLMMTIDPSTDQLGVLTIPSGGTLTLNGDSGSAIGNPLTLTALNGGNNSGSSVKFSASGTTVILDVTDANNNTMLGNGSGNVSITGNSNTAFGFETMNVATNASGNNAFGLQTLVALIDGGNNTGMGQGALSRVTHGNANIGFGLSAGNAFTTGSFNLCFGYQSGVFNSGSDSNNVYIGHNGVSGDNNIMRFGNGTGSGQQQIISTYMSGVNGNTLTGTPMMVVINSSGGNIDQLGVAAIPAGAGYPLPLTVVTASTQALSINNSYASNNSTVPVVFTLPTTAAVGTEIEVLGFGSHGWSISQNASQLIYIGSQVSSTGTGGSIASTQANNTIVLKCVVADTTFVAKLYIGNLTVV